VEHDESVSLRGCTILLVEEDLESREGLRPRLEQLGARVSIARDELAGLTQLASLRADAVLCDLATPGLDGLEFARRVRRTPRLRRTLLVAVTGRQEHEDFLRTWDAGFDAHLVRPVTAEMLHAFARRLCGRRARQSQRGA
jgi:CheY-like chemotaxis protein